MSYNFAHSDAVNNAFLQALMQPPYRREDLNLPAPRSIAGIQAKPTPIPAGIFRLSSRHPQHPLGRLPPADPARQYFNLMQAQVCNLSLARDFNQITEILMAANLRQLPPERLALFIDLPHQPLYQHFSWYRG